MKHQFSQPSKVQTKDLKFKPSVSKINSVIYLQIGLILSLLTAIYLLEYKTKVVTITPSFFELPSQQKDEILPLSAFKVESPKIITQLALKHEITKPDFELEPKVVEEDVIKRVVQKVLPAEKPLENLTPDKVLEVAPDPDENRIHSILTVSTAPVYPGCESCKTNNELIKCFSAKVNKLFAHHFDYRIIDDYQISGKQRIAVKFMVDKQGQVKDIIANSRFKVLSEEAMRIMRKIKIMKPAQQGNQNVNVTYTLPITFLVN